jgi:hypothetical protein
MSFPTFHTQLASQQIKPSLPLSAEIQEHHGVLDFKIPV